ncbi:MAG TPA: response regulator transcription factor [Deltaproteobacteria bacterium]|nr:response regulator transcription factor [Deltaproteobacteria bacterium]HXK48674.1 response regulator transcription factor [Deltaproteobacteria bacterium]
MQSRMTVLYVGSTIPFRSRIQEHLEREGHFFHHTDAWSSGVVMKSSPSPDLVLLEVSVSDRSGFDRCRDIRHHHDGMLIVIMDHDDDLDKMLALEFGADDVLAMQAFPRFVMARIDASLRGLRRIRHHGRNRCITVGDLKVDASRREAFMKDNPLELTTIQFDLLWYLAENAGVVVTRDNLCRVLFDAEYNGVDRSVDVYISRIRHKMGDDPANPSYLKTVRGVGYLLAGNLG